MDYTKRNGHKTFTLLVCAAFMLLSAVQFASSCNEMVCASIVSKCMLTQSCKCDMKNCTCCKECADCLSYLYTECCSCLEMCPKPIETSSELSKQSHIEDLEGFTNLYNVITSEQDPQGRWKVISFPIDIDAALYGPKADSGTKYVVHSTDMDIKQKFEDPNKITVNCTVAYQAQCMSWNKCKQSCSTMGASSYRVMFFPTMLLFPQPNQYTNPLHQVACIVPSSLCKTFFSRYGKNKKREGVLQL
ncbi:protein twisted gastrulation isoform X3 [Anopheles cruzii]|uniref:protein twisted gastrulation isoform X3 n=1 Tax=Anopheles cruzii TaxID=68878 RepID=UPI0022EC5A76|nr:protein twisted gastrulation isoform X3 [Anopheles cruzii]